MSASPTLARGGLATFKDANDCLMADVPDTLMRAALDKARDFAPDKIIAAQDLEAEFLKWVFERPVAAGVELPFAFPLRFRTGETTLWLGIEKSGKTTLLSFATVAAIYQGERALIAGFETKWMENHDKLCRQTHGGLYFDKRTLRDVTEREHRNNILQTSREQASAAHQWLAQNLWYYNHVGIGNWRQLIEDIRWARRRLGITWVVVDNFMRLGIPKDDYSQQADAIIKFVALSMELDIHLHMVLHQNKSEGEKGKKGGKRTASGAHELLANPHNIVEVTRDDVKGKQVAELYDKKRNSMISDVEFLKEQEEISIKPDGKFILHAQRNADIEAEGKQDGSKYLWFMWEAQQYTDVPPAHPKYGPLKFLQLPKQGNLPNQEPEKYDRKIDDADVPTHNPAAE